MNISDISLSDNQIAFDILRKRLSLDTTFQFKLLLINGCVDFIFSATSDIVIFFSSSFSFNIFHIKVDLIISLFALNIVFYY